MEKSAVLKIEKICYATLKYIFSIFIGFLISKINIGQNMSPFSLSLLSVVPFTKINHISLFIGSFLGYISKEYLIDNFKYICANIIMFAIILIAGNSFYKKMYSPVLPAMICFSVGFIFLFSAEFTIVAVLLLLCESVICGCLAFFIKYSYSSFSKRTKLKSKDYISINITTIILICALDSFYIYSTSVSIVFIILLVYLSSYFLETKTALLFTSTFCAIPLILNPSKSIYFILLYIPAVVCIIISKFEKRHIISSYILSYIAIYTMNFQSLSFTINFSPLYSAILYILLPKKKLQSYLEDYLPIDNNVATTDYNELCENYNKASKELLNRIENATVKPLLDSKKENRIKKYLKSNGCDKINITNYYNETGKQIISIQYTSDKNVSTENLKRKISVVCNTNFISASEVANENNITISFEQSEAYKIECFALYKAKRGESICGDSVTAFKTPDGFYYLIIADGMGSGKEAYNKSYNAITIIKKILKTSNDLHSAVSTVNSSIELLKDGIGFSTLDIFKISLDTATAEIIKCGATNSYIIRENKLFKIESGGFPAGLTDNLSYSKNTFQLNDKDVIVMTSDGVTISKEQLQSILLINKDKSIESIAKNIINECNDIDSIDDDKSVLIANIKRAQ